ncbi:hypothetical protein [Peptoniphilus senegalensis]|uniref:Uncharacterized protein n=1 Tax=Peptoniphilus senegalensis TaxID=1465757 RepID=A0ABV1J2A2_9FIRM
MDKKQISKQLMALFLSILMIVGILPLNIFAEEPQLPGTSTRAVDPEGKPSVNWEEDATATDDGSGYWSLPENVKIIKGQRGADPLNTLGFTYLGRYYDQNGRIVLKFEVSQRNQADSSVWDRFVMRFPAELYQKIDREASYVLWKQTEVFSINNFDTLDVSTVRGQSTNCLQFPYRNVGIQYGHREVNIVLKADTDWDATFAQKTQAVQLRLYNADNNNLKIFSTAGGYKGADYAALGYNTYTKIAVVGDLSKRPKDLMEATTKSMTQFGGQNDQFHSADSALQLDRDNKKVRLIYTFASDVTSGKMDGDKYAIRQTLDRDFIKYLDLGNKGKTAEEKNQIGSIYFLSENETPIGTKLPIYASYIEGLELNPDGSAKLDGEGNPTFNREDGAVFLQFAETGFEYKDNPDSADPNYVESVKTDFNNILRNGNQGSGSIMVFEYNIDPEKINEDLVKDKELSKNFMFDTRYILSNNRGVRKYTTTTTEDIVIQPNKNNFFTINFNPYVNISSAIGTAAEMKDFVLNIGGSEGIWKSWKREGHAFFPDTDDYAINMYGWQFYMKDYNIKTGMTIKAGTPITVYLPNLDYGNKSRVPDFIDFDIVTGERKGLSGDYLKNKTSLTGNKILRLEKVTNNGSDLFYPPMYFKNSISTVGATAVIEKYVPIVDEIFTDSKEFTGIMRSEGGVRSELYIPEENKSTHYLGKSFINTEENKDGDITAYLRSDGKEEAQKFAVNNDGTSDIFEKRIFDKKEYEGLAFNIKKQYFGAESIKYATQNKAVEELGLLRDQPIVFTTYSETSLKSEPVIEQVQTKVKFDLNGQTSKENLNVIEKIAPLSNQYRYDYLTGEVNKDYKPSGFEGDYVRYVDENNKTKEVDGRTYQNIISHDGLEYDLTNKDQKAAFLKRQMPTKDEINVPQGKRILGWTTTKLTDIAGGKTAVEQFNELRDNNKVIKEAKDWEKVDANENYIFDSKSPIDKERTVYAVYGEGINIVLHSNNTADPKDETTITIPVTISDIDNTNKIIDQVSSATLSKMKGNLVIKGLPKVPVTGEQSEIDKITDANAKLFNIPNNSFLGWTLYRYSNDPQESKLIAGKNNERIGELLSGVVSGGTKRIPKSTEWIKDLRGDQYKYTRYIPNTFSIALRAQDVPSKDNNDGVGIYNIFLDAIDEGKDLHLYANYRPFFEVKVHPSYMNIDKNQGEFGKYVDTVEEANKKAVNVGLLHRTAVTDYGTPTVHQNASYYPLPGGAASLKAWDGKSTTPLTWKVPGFDELGQRKSYVSVIVTDNLKDAYANFKAPNWGSLGAKTYIRLQDATATQDPNAPKNLHENAGNPYGDPVAKDQSFTLGVDAFTSATSRKSLLTTGDNEEVIGYEIWNTSTPIDIPKPVFDNVYDDETEAKLHWTDAEKNADIKKIILKVADDAEVTLVKQNDGTYTDGTITARPNGDKLVLSPLDLTGKAGKDIVAKYVVEKSGQEVTGPEGRITINERGTSAPVEEMKQIPNDADGKSKIEFKVPDPVLNKPTKGTVYTAQKWDETQNKWVDLGKVTLDSDNDKGTKKEITLDDKVNDGDIVRIKSEQPNLNPSDSTGTGDANYTPQDGDENRKYVKIDKAGPEANVTAKDETFRRFIDLEGTIKEIPAGRKVKITIDYKDGNPVEMEKEITVENKANIIKELNTVLRKGIEDGNIPEIKITAVDEFGNSKDSKVDYTESYQLKVLITGERAGKKFVKVSADKANATVTIKVMNNGQEVSSASATVTAPNTFVKVRFNNGYALKSGDELVISGTATENGKTYTSNPFKMDIK